MASMMVLGECRGGAMEELVVGDVWVSVWVKVYIQIGKQLGGAGN